MFRSEGVQDPLPSCAGVAHRCVAVVASMDDDAPEASDLPAEQGVLGRGSNHEHLEAVPRDGMGLVVAPGRQSRFPSRGGEVPPALLFPHRTITGVVTSDPTKVGDSGRAAGVAASSRRPDALVRGRAVLGPALTDAAA